METCEVQLSWRIVLLNVLIQSQQRLVHGRKNTMSSLLSWAKIPIKVNGAATIMGGRKLNEVLYPVCFMTTGAAVRGAEEEIFITTCHICGLNGRGMNILCFSDLARRPMAIQGVVSISVFRSSCDGPATMRLWDQDTLPMFLLVSVMFAL